MDQRVKTQELLRLLEDQAVVLVGLLLLKDLEILQPPLLMAAMAHLLPQGKEMMVAHLLIQHRNMERVVVVALLMLVVMEPLVLAVTVEQELHRPFLEYLQLMLVVGVAVQLLALLQQGVLVGVVTVAFVVEHP